MAMKKRRKESAHLDFCVNRTTKDFPDFKSSCTFFIQSHNFPFGMSLCFREKARSSSVTVAARAHTQIPCTDILVASGLEKTGYIVWKKA